MIDDVIINSLKQISDERGKVMHMLRDDSEGFAGLERYIFPVSIPRR